ncbi:MAG: chromosomal replication initiator protein DnaA [Alphaproteobacteria bacterium]|nr:chromosomal replication initiator protein DnaA [Alphaproteobacteria bacterium]
MNMVTAPHEEATGVGMEADWSNVLGRLKSEFDDNVFNSWFKPLALVNIENGCAIMATPTRFMRNWLESNYADRIRCAWKTENPSVTDINFIVLSGFNKAKPETATAEEASVPQPDRRKSSIITQKTSEFGAPLDPRFTFESFVVGKSNELAYAAARRVAENKEVHFNPLFLHSGVGLGKTHLMHAIAWANREKFPDRRVVYLSAEQFMYQFITSIRYKDTMSFKQKFRSVDLLMIDDLQFIANKQSTQEEFFHTFNALVDQNKQIIVSADRAPSDLNGVEERLRSRLAWGLVADIHPSTYELRLGILQSKRENLGADVPNSVLEFLALKVTSNIRELEGALNRIVAHADVSKQEITLESTQDVLQELLRAHDRCITIDEIQRKVAEHYNLRLSDMHSARRARNVARPRQVAMYLSKMLTARSLPEIGRKFGGRDHTTVMHAIRKVEELMGDDAQIAQDVEVVRRALTG